MARALDFDYRDYRLNAGGPPDPFSKESVAPRSPVALAKAAIALALGIRVLVAAKTEIYHDEAYYWLWSQRLDAGYFDHSPLIAWLIALLGIRGTALVCGVATIAVVGRFAREVHGSSGPGWIAAALWACAPGSVLASVFATPDSPLYLFWALAAWAVFREEWIWAGVAVGFALLSKYSAALIPVAVLITLVRHRHLPWRAWIAGGIGLLLFLPVIYWNATHDWVGFLFQLRHGAGGGTGGVKSFAEFSGAQFLMAGPLTLVGIGIALRRRGQPLLLVALTVAPVLVFGALSLGTRGEANWAVPAYLTGSVLLAGVLSRRQALAAIGSALVVSAVGAAHLIWPLVRADHEPLITRIHGWTVLSRLNELQVQAVYAPSYQLASEVAYYAGLPSTVAGERRTSQFDLWPQPVLAEGDSVAWISERDWQEPPAELVSRFQSVSKVGVWTSEYGGKTVHTFHVWRLEGTSEPLTLLIE